MFIRILNKVVNITVAASTSLYEPYRLNREKKARGLVRREEEERERGDEIKRGDILQQEIKSKAVTVERKGEKTGTGKLSVRNHGKYRSSLKLCLSKDLHLKGYRLHQMILAADGRVDGELAGKTCSTICAILHCKMCMLECKHLNVIPLFFANMQHE